MVEQPSVAETPLPPTAPDPMATSAARRGSGLGVKGVLLAMAAAFILGAGLIGWLAWHKGFDFGLMPGSGTVSGSRDADDALGQTAQDRQSAKEQQQVTAEAAQAVEKVEHVAQVQGWKGFQSIW